MVTQYSFRTDPGTVKAFQMTEERRTDNSNWPLWLHRAWNMERGEPGSLYPTVPGTSTGALSVTMRGRCHGVLWGDWLVEGPDDSLYLCSPDFFEATFHPAQVQPVEPKTVKVRVAVCVTESGAWGSAGWSAAKGSAAWTDGNRGRVDDDELMGDAMDILRQELQDEGFKTYFLTAELPTPAPPVVVQAKVERTPPKGQSGTAT